MPRIKERESGFWPTANTGGVLSGSGSREMVQSKVKEGKITEDEAINMIGVKLWPTPASSDCREWESTFWSLRNSKTVGGKIGQLNPDWVEWLMGWPIFWSSLDPIKELLWLDWNVDPADMKSNDKWPTPRCFMAYDARRKKESSFKNIEDIVYEREKRNWPTPRRGDCQNQSKNATIKRIKDGGDVMLSSLIKHTLNYQSGIIPRVGVNIKDRISRLKAIGNGQVPQCMAKAFEILNKEETTEYGCF